MEPDLPADPLNRAAPEPGPSLAAREAARLGLYVHVPFCARRCAYCGFATGAISSRDVERYLSAIEIEAARRAPSATGLAFTSVFLGGGTPSALSSRHFGRLWRSLTSHFALEPSAEVTLEANPETVRPGLLETWRAAGVNRLSMGAQSFDPAELERLGRIHDADRPAVAVQLAREHGFHRISIDLMFGFPGHGAATWDRTLGRALDLDLEHLSIYCFVPEEDTVMGDAALRGAAELPSPEMQAALYTRMTSRLEAAGYAGYETSNFARPGGECRHNLVYWLRRDYLALGPSAHGLWRGRRYANLRDLGRWAAALERGLACDDGEPASEERASEERVMLALRLGTGLRAADHDPTAWDETMRRHDPGLNRAVATGRLERIADGYRVASRHRFVADDVIAWVMAETERSRAAKRSPLERVDI